MEKGDNMKLTTEVVKNISKIKNEDEFMTNFRLKSLEKFNELDLPNFGPEINIDFDTITYYKERSNELTDDWNKISCPIKQEFDELGVISAEKKYLDGIAAQYETADSKATNWKDLAKANPQIKAPSYIIKPGDQLNIPEGWKKKQA